MLLRIKIVVGSGHWYTQENRRFCVDSLGHLALSDFSAWQASLLEGPPAMHIIESQQSEIALLRQQIEGQLVAMRRGLSGLSSGSARHAFINARMDQIGVCQDSLARQLGSDTADMLVYGLYNDIMDAEVV
jgi:hypothetical protein